MKGRIIGTLIAAIALGCAGTTYADLGDTYAISVERYGGRGDTWPGQDFIAWFQSPYYIGEVFHKNQCVSIF